MCIRYYQVLPLRFNIQNINKSLTGASVYYWLFHARVLEQWLYGFKFKELSTAPAGRDGLVPGKHIPEINH